VTPAWAEWPQSIALNGLKSCTIRADIADMSTAGADDRLREAFERYRSVMKTYPARAETPIDVAAARIDLTLRLVEAGEPLPEPVTEQLQEDALLLVDKTAALAPGS
jgi:hypothetical protein